MLSILRVENHETVPRRPVDDFTHFVAAVGNFVCRQRVAEPVTEFTSVEIFKRKGKRQFGDQRAGGGVVIQCFRRKSGRGGRCFWLQRNS